MKIIVIEDMVYKVTESDYKKIIAKELEINNRVYQHSNDFDMDSFLESLKHRFKEVGRVNFDFRL